MSYVLFCQKNASGQFCAVPMGAPAPSFIAAPGWAFAGTCEADQAQPEGFHEDAARQACQEQGFYAYRADKAETVPTLH